MLTSDATEAARLAVQQQLEKDVPAPGIDAATVQWKELFRSEPWDPEGKVRSCKRSHPLYVQHLLRFHPNFDQDACDRKTDHTSCGSLAL